MFDANIYKKILYVQCQRFQKSTISLLSKYCMIKFKEG